MKSKSVNQKIKRLRNIEKMARELQGKIRILRNEWQDIIADVQGTDEYVADCDKLGYVQSYNFSDVLS